MFLTEVQITLCVAKVVDIIAYSEAEKDAISWDAHEKKHNLLDPFDQNSYYSLCWVAQMFTVLAGRR